MHKRDGNQGDTQVDTIAPQKMAGRPKSKNPRDYRLMIRLTQDVGQRLESAAQEEGRTCSNFVAVLLERELERREAEASEAARE